jgi:probable addiction module antidote protein
MALNIKPFDAAKYFPTKEAQARLFNDALATGDAGYIANALGVIARARGMSQLAEETGLNRQTLYKALSPSGNPSLDTLMKVTAALGLELRSREGKDAA